MRLLEKFLKKELNEKEGLKESFRSMDECLELFSMYNAMLLEWNKNINLMSRKTSSIENHILNSIFFLTKYPLTGKEKLIDIGTGGGFPGIPLKILYPDLKITFLDSIRKKTMVLEDITSRLGLKAPVLTGRAEEFAQKPNFKGKFEVVISKAVSTLDNVYKWGEGFLSGNGRMICIKGGDMSGEINLLKRSMPSSNTQIIEYSFPAEYNIEDKKIVIIKK